MKCRNCGSTTDYVRIFKADRLEVCSKELSDIMKMDTTLDVKTVKRKDIREILKKSLDTAYDNPAIKSKIAEMRNDYIRPHFNEADFLNKNFFDATLIITTLIMLFISFFIIKNTLFLISVIGVATVVNVSTLYLRSRFKKESASLINQQKNKAYKSYQERNEQFIKNKLFNYKNISKAADALYIKCRLHKCNHCKKLGME